MQTPRRRLRTLAVTSALAAAVTVAFTGIPFANAAPAKPAASAPKVANPNAEGKRQATKFLSLLTGKATPALRDFLSPAFLLQRADGTYATKAQYLKAVTNITHFTITDVKATIQGSTLVARYTATAEQVVEGKAYKKDPAPRLSTFVWAGGAWRLISHANFNTPAAS